MTNDDFRHRRAKSGFAAERTKLLVTLQQINSDISHYIIQGRAAKKGALEKAKAHLSLVERRLTFITHPAPIASLKNDLLMKKIVDDPKPLLSRAEALKLRSGMLVRVKKPGWHKWCLLIGNPSTRLTDAGLHVYCPLERGDYNAHISSNDVVEVRRGGFIWPSV